MNQQQDTIQKTSEQPLNTSPNPSRFAVYNILPGEFGFTIPNCDFVFEFDRYGGWFDEYGNYYNSRGEPSEVPVEYEEDLPKDVQYGYYVDDPNNPDNENERPEEKEDDPLEFYDNQHLNTENKETIEKYPNGKQIDVEIHNLSMRWNEDEFEKFLTDNKIEWIVFEFEYDDKDLFSGTCYISLDKENTLKLIGLNGYQMFGKNFNILVMNPKSPQEDNQKESANQPNPKNEAPKEEEKTFENDKNEITYKRPHPQGTAVTSAELESMQKKEALNKQKNGTEKTELSADGKNKSSNNGD